MGGASAGSGGSDQSDEKKVDTYADQLKKEQAKKSKFTTDKFGYNVPKKKSFVPPSIAIVKGIFGNQIDQHNLNRRMKFANKNNINLQGLSTEQILSKDFKSQIDAKGYTKAPGNVGGNDNRGDNNPILSTNTEATKQVASSGIVTNNGIVAPTTAEVSQATSTMMSDAEISVANKKKGRSTTILNRATGLGNSSLNTTKKTLGA